MIRPLGAWQAIRTGLSFLAAMSAGVGRTRREGRRPRRSAAAREDGARKTGLPSIWRRGRNGRQPVPEEAGRRRWNGSPRARCAAGRRRRPGGPAVGEVLGF